MIERNQVNWKLERERKLFGLQKEDWKVRMRFFFEREGEEATKVCNIRTKGIEKNSQTDQKQYYNIHFISFHSLSCMFEERERERRERIKRNVNALLFVFSLSLSFL